MVIFASISLFTIRLIKVLEDEERKEAKTSVDKNELAMSSIKGDKEDLQIEKEPS